MQPHTWISVNSCWGIFQNALGRVIVTVRKRKCQANKKMVLLGLAWPVGTVCVFGRRFSEALQRCSKRPGRDTTPRGRVLGRTSGREIPCRVAPQQNSTPFLPARIVAECRPFVLSVDELRCAASRIVGGCHPPISGSRTTVRCRRSSFAC